MFSGLTNQVTSWIGAAKGEPHDEDVPVPANSQPVAAVEQHQVLEETAGEQPVAEGQEEGGDKKAGSMFSNVKGWLGSAAIPSMPAMPSMPSMPAMPSIPSIPGLRKGAGEGGEIGADGSVSGDLQAQNELNLTGDGGGGDDEDKSSATEGADSRPASGVGTPTEEQAGHVGNVTTKVTQGAKTFGSFLYSAVNKAGARIQETVKHNPILGDFNKEQDAFIKGQANRAEASVAPWVGHTNEQKIKEEILSLSQDRRNYVRAPPAGVDFQFDYDVSYPVAVAIMGEDPALEKMRFELVPKIITEENFWRNYFYRVSLIIQAGDLGTLGADGSLMGQGSSEDGELVEIATKIQKLKAISDSEFVSETFQSTIIEEDETALEEIKADIRKLGIDSLVHEAADNEEQWEKDLEAELQEYEVVKNHRSSKTSTTVVAGHSSGVVVNPDNDDDNTIPIQPLSFRNKPQTNPDWEEGVDDILLSDDSDLK